MMKVEFDQDNQEYFWSVRKDRKEKHKKILAEGDNGRLKMKQY